MVEVTRECSTCNLALGHVGDDIVVLEEMIKYLKDTP